ncbi:hypothetical protein J4410_04965 [Candidatus Woesearchaeota archaeon]|nr:hypothetical protein [Candidatus Woesearchaeota archaeon]
MEKKKDLNISYNIDYNRDWNEKIIKRDRNKKDIRFDQHVFDREDYRELDLNKVEETVRKGKIIERKCEEPNKICFQHYFGKENITYIVIIRDWKEFIEVKTAWTKKGR